MIDLKRIPKTEFASAVAQVAGERNIDVEVVLNSVQSAILAAFERSMSEIGKEVNEEDDYIVDLDSETGKMKVFKVEDDEKKDVTPPDFGRIAAQTAKQVILQKVREAEKGAIIDQFRQRVGTLVSGVVLYVQGSNVIVGIGKARAVMPKEEQVPGEYYQSSKRMSFYLKEISEVDDNETLIVSRAAPELIVELFRREVPEVGSGVVEIKRIARRPGFRTKVAVYSNKSRVDPVGSCVGQKGVRVQAVINELNDEKIDAISFSADKRQFIISALSPAEKVEVVKIDEENKKAVVRVDEDELAMAIGDKGENVSVAGELVGYEIEILGQKKDKDKDNEKN